MKVVILAGGFGTRLSEETAVKPKPMVLIGGKPILWHIMKHYSYFGYEDFVICLGYKGEVIRDYFFEYFRNHSDLHIDLETNQMSYSNVRSEKWKVTLADTGPDTLTGGRIKRIQPYIGDQPFMLTYGDGIGDINVKALVDFHHQHGKKVTLTSVVPEGRFGALELEGDQVTSFREKSQADLKWINAGYFVCQPEVFDTIKGDQDMWEAAPLETLASEGELKAYLHRGFWHPIDSLSDKNKMESLWQQDKAPWKSYVVG